VQISGRHDCFARCQTHCRLVNSIRGVALRGSISGWSRPVGTQNSLGTPYTGAIQKATAPQHVFGSQSCPSRRCPPHSVPPGSVCLAWWHGAFKRRATPQRERSPSSRWTIAMRLYVSTACSVGCSSLTTWFENDSTWATLATACSTAIVTAAADEVGEATDEHN
jgi:hypothetical protein